MNFPQFPNSEVTKQQNYHFSTVKDSNDAKMVLQGTKEGVDAMDQTRLWQNSINLDKPTYLIGGPSNIAYQLNLSSLNNSQL